MIFSKVVLLIKKFRYEIIALIFTIYGLYLRFACLANRVFWDDELSSLARLQKSFIPFWHRFNYTDYTFFPGEYILNWPFVFIFKTNKWGIAVPHILLTWLGFYFLYLICKRYLNSIFAWVAVFALVALNRELIFHSFELRPYGVLPTLALAAFYFSEEIVSKRYSLSLARKILIGCLLIFTIIYHVYGAIILFFIFVFFLLQESGEYTFKEIFKHSYRFIFIIILIGLPLYLWYSLGSPQVYKNSGYLVYTFEYIPNPIYDFFGFIKSNLCNLIGNRLFYPMAALLILPFILPLKERLRQIGFLFVLIILPIFVIFYSNLLLRYHILQRQFTWAMPLFAFLIGWCLDSLIKPIRYKKSK